MLGDTQRMDNVKQYTQNVVRFVINFVQDFMIEIIISCHIHEITLEIIYVNSCKDLYSIHKCILMFTDEKQFKFLGESNTPK